MGLNLFQVDCKKHPYNPVCFVKHTVGKADDIVNPNGGGGGSNPPPTPDPLGIGGLSLKFFPANMEFLPDGKKNPNYTGTPSAPKGGDGTPPPVTDDVPQEENNTKKILLWSGVGVVSLVVIIGVIVLIRKRK